MSMRDSKSEDKDKGEKEYIRYIINLVKWVSMKIKSSLMILTKLIDQLD